MKEISILCPFIVLLPVKHLMDLSLYARKNGTLIGMVHKDVKTPLFPTVAVHSQNEEYASPFSLKFIILI